MRVFATFVLLGFRRWSAYPMAAAAGAFANIMFGLIGSAIMLAAVASAGGSIAGYDSTSGPTYVWLSQAMIGPVQIFASSELAQRIRSGDIAVDLARPVDVQLAHVAGDFGRAAFQFLPRGLPPLLVGALVTGFTLPGTVQPYLLGMLSLVLAVGVSGACRWLLNLLGFWLLDVRGPMALYLVAVNVLSGLLVPVHWFPGWLGALAAASPFPSILQTPIDIVTARIEGWPALQALAVQLAWLAGLLVAGHFAFRAGARRLVVQGG